MMVQRSVSEPRGLHEVLARMERGAEIDGSRLAVDLGYYDQAHFIRDFKETVGEPPGLYAERLRARLQESSLRSRKEGARQGGWRFWPGKGQM